jgi:hypothetical protein
MPKSPTAQQLGINVSGYVPPMPKMPGRVHIDPAKLDPAKLAIAERIAELVKAGAPDSEIEPLLQDLEA